jgi:hypothetical protein
MKERKRPGQRYASVIYRFFLFQRCRGWYVCAMFTVEILMEVAGSQRKEQAVYVAVLQDGENHDKVIVFLWLLHYLLQHIQFDFESLMTPKILPRQPNRPVISGVVFQRSDVPPFDLDPVNLTKGATPDPLLSPVWEGTLRPEITLVYNVLPS